jgi:hypothetical protein
MMLPRARGLAAVAALTILALPGAAQAQAPAAQSGEVTRNLQGGDNHAWTDNPHMHAFYDAVVAAVGKDPKKADVPALEAKARKIFGEFAVSMGADPKAMQDHLKLIPGQIVKIAQEDPHVLDTYDNFTEALMGPK